jgi:hypothetical protein
VSYEITKRLDVTADFRFKATGHTYFRGSTAGTIIDHFPYRSHSMFLGIRYAFG